MDVDSKTRTYTTYHCGKQFRLTDSRIMARYRREPRRPFNVDAPWHSAGTLLRPPSGNYYTDFINRYLARWQRRNRALTVRIRMSVHRNLPDMYELLLVTWYGTDIRGDESSATVKFIRRALEERISCEVIYTYGEADTDS